MLSVQSKTAGLSCSRHICSGKLFEFDEQILDGRHRINLRTPPKVQTQTLDPLLHPFISHHIMRDRNRNGQKFDIH